MDGSRGAWAAWSGAVCAGAAALAALLAAMFAGPAWRFIVVALAVVAGIAFLLLLAIAFQPVWAWLRQRWPHREPPTRPAVTDRWRFTTNAMYAPVAARLGQYGLDHPAYMRPADAVLPSMRVMSLVACGPLGDEPESSDLRALFLAMLARPGFMDLITDLTDARPGVSWQLRATPRRSNLKADLTGHDPTEVPVASAMLELPMTDLRLAGNDPRCAHLILHVDLPASGDAAGLPAWRHRIILALRLAGELARFLTEIGLPTSSDPAAQLAVLLQARQALTEIIDPGGIKALPSTYVVNESAGYLIADPAGEPAARAASRVMRDLSERVLHLDGSADEMSGLESSAG